MKNFFDIEDNFNAIIEKNIPNAKIKKIERISNGWTNFVFKVSTTNGEEYFFRFPRNDFFSNALVDEITFNNLVKTKISFKTTDLILKYHNGRPFSMHKLIKGKNLYDVLNIMPQDKKVKFCDDICIFIKQLQNIDFSTFPKFRKLSDFLYELATISDINGKYDFSLHNELIKQENSNKLVVNHGDLNPGNILINSNFEIEAIFDFAFCTKSSKINDLSRLIGRMPEEFKNLLISSYEKIFNTKIDLISLEKHINMWNYVDKNYINYMKINCPDVVIPSTKLT